MEFRCRLGTAAGQVIEGVYVAPSEAHLRRELEDKGLHVLALAPRGGVQGFSIGRRRIRRDEFLIEAVVEAGKRRHHLHHDDADEHHREHGEDGRIEHGGEGLLAHRVDDLRVGHEPPQHRVERAAAFAGDE